MSTESEVRDIGNKAVEALQKIADSKNGSKNSKGDTAKTTKNLKQVKREVEEFGKASLGTAQDLKNMTQAITNLNTTLDRFKETMEGISKVKFSFQTSKGDIAGLSKVKAAVTELKKFTFSNTSGERQTGGLQILNEDLRKARDNIKRVVSELKELQKWMSKINSQGGFNVHVNNKGFQSLLNVAQEYEKAITNFKRRNGNEDKNFIETAFGTKESNKKAEQELVQDAKQVASQFKKEFSEEFADNIKTKIVKAISTGIKEGVEEGAEKGKNGIYGTAFDDIAHSVMNMGTVLKLNLGGRLDLAETMVRMATGTIDPLRLKEQKDRHLEERYRIAKKEETRLKIAESKRETDLRYLLNNPSKKDEATNALIKQYTYDMERAKIKYEQMANREKQGREARQNYYKDIMRLQKEFQDYQGRELTNYDKARLKLGYEIEKWEELHKRAENNKYDQSQLYSLLQRITKETRKYAEETYKASKGYDEIKKRAQALHKLLTGIASGFQRASSAIGAINGIFSTARSMAQSLFGYLTNRFRSFIYQVKSGLTSAIKAGIDQFKSLESAKISFESFFGVDRADSVLREVRKQALSTPIVTAGELADYVSQLAPVSNGNASLAINAALGALKTIAYSGSDTSEMEYVIKNIRDVVAKGKATAIDIRQFNRAMPALEQAIKKTGLEGFINSEGQLEINKNNVGRVLDMFATLNTDEDSPLKDINERQLKTLDGMYKLLEERRTSTVEEILTDSGVFQLVQDIFGVGGNEAVWTTIKEKFTSPLRRFVGFLRQIPWAEVGKKLSEGWKTISTAIKEAWADLKGALEEVTGGYDWRSALHSIVEVIVSFVNGFKEGLKGVIFTYNQIKNLLGEETLKKLATAIGFLVSPAGKIISNLLSLSRDMLNGFSRVFATLDSITNGYYKSKLAHIEKAAGRYADQVTTSSITGARTLFNSKGQLAQVYGDKIVQGNMMYSAGKAQHLTTRTLGVKSSWDDLSIRDKAANVGTWNYIKGTVSNAVSTIANYAMKALKAAALAYAANQLIDGLAGAAKSAQTFGSATDGVVNTISVLTKALVGGIAGAMVGGLTGGLVGAAIAATVALNGLYNDWKKQKEEEARAELQVQLDADHQKQYDAIMEEIGKAGISTDTGRDEGFYAAAKLKQYINSFEDPRMIDYSQAIQTYVNALRFGETRQAIHDFANSEEYNHLGGPVVDIDNNAEIRAQMAEMIRWFRLVGDDYDYDNTADETLVKEWLNGDTLTEGQAKALKEKWGDLDETIGANTTSLKDNVNTVTGAIKDVKDELNANSQSLDKLRASIDFYGSDNMMMNILRVIDPTTVSKYEQIATKGTYLNPDNGRVYGIADVWQFINNKMEELNSKENRTPAEERLLYLLGQYNYQSMQGYMTDPNFDAGQWFATMIQDPNFGDEFRSFMDRMGIEGSIDDYFTNGDPMALFQEEAQRFRTFVEQNPATIGIHVDTTLTEEDKAKLTEEATAAGQMFGHSFWNAFSGVHPLLGGWWGSFFGFSRNANGGIIKPIYRAGGGTGARGVDTVPAMLQPGEFVVRKSAVDKVGLSSLVALNRGDLMSAARNLGATTANNSYNNSRNWSSVVNNNQRSAHNEIRIFNRNNGGRINTYRNLANRIALA